MSLKQFIPNKLLSYIQKLYLKGHPYLTMLYLKLPDWYLKEEIPLIVYQMGKVGSTSLYLTLAWDRFNSFHMHSLIPTPHNQKSINFLSNIPFKDWLFRKRHAILKKNLYNTFIIKNRPVKFITPIRDPISRNISDFFQSYSRFIGNKNISNLNQQELLAIFLEQYRHSIPLTWFDRKLKPILDIDVYNYPFPVQNGYQIIKKGNYEVLIYKLEISNDLKEKAIAEFLNVNEFKLTIKNESLNKSYGQIYQAFKQNVKLPQPYIETMCTSKYTKHFYSLSEIEQIRLKWEKKAHNYINS